MKNYLKFNQLINLLFSNHKKSKGAFKNGGIIGERKDNGLLGQVSTRYYFDDNRLTKEQKKMIESAKGSKIILMNEKNYSDSWNRINKKRG